MLNYYSNDRFGKGSDISDVKVSVQLYLQEDTKLEIHHPIVFTIFVNKNADLPK